MRSTYFGDRTGQLLFALTAAVLLGACTQPPANFPTEDSTSYEASKGSSGVRRVGALEGFYSPEAVRYDPDQDVYFISNMLGFGSDKDGAGYIVRVDASELGRMQIFAQGGRNGVTLNAPKGMALQGDTLWVNDIDVVRGFDRRSGASVATIDLRDHGAVLLNDIAIGPDGTLRITDSGIIMSSKGVLHPGGDKVFVVGAGRAVTIAAQGEHLGRPNGIIWDNAGKRWLVVSFDPFKSELYSLRDGDSTRTVIGGGKGKFDGVEIAPNGGVLVSSWSDSSIHLFAKGSDRRIIKGLVTPADMAIDTRRNRVAVPLVMLNRVEFWELPKS